MSLDYATTDYLPPRKAASRFHKSYTSQSLTLVAGALKTLHFTKGKINGSNQK